MHNQSLITCNSHNLKCIHLPKTCSDKVLFFFFFRTPFFLKYFLNINTLLFFYTSENLRCLAKSSRKFFSLPISLSFFFFSFLIRTFLALLNEQTFSCIHGKNCLPMLSQVHHATFIDWLVFEDDEILIGSFKFNTNIA